MAQTKLTTIQGATTVFTTELNTLASDGNKLSTAISNDGSGEHFPYCMVEINLGTQTARSAGAHVAIYILPTIDGGTNFSLGADATDASPSNLAATLAVPADTTAVRVVIYGVPLPPTDFKILLENKTGQAFNASGNTLKIAQYTVESV